jgi:hypothetical protein
MLRGTLYRPLDFLMDHTPLKDPLVDYMLWWQKLAHRL